MGKLHGVEARVSACSMARRGLASVAPSAKNQVLKMLPNGGTKSSGKQFCGILFGVKVFTFMVVLLGHGESGPVLGLKLLCLLYTSPSPRDRQKSRMPSSA